MRTSILIVLLAALGCSEKGSESDTARVSDTPRSDTAMAGMDHSKMGGGMAASDTLRGDTAMAGMDHSKPAGASPSTGERDPVAGMDHSRMPGMAGPAGSGDRSRMPGMATPAPSAAGMAGMDHSQMGATGAAPSTARASSAGRAPAVDHTNMPGMSNSRTSNMPGMANMPGMGNASPNTARTPAAGDVKLDRLLTELLKDPVVQQRVRSDSTLRNRWDEAARRTILPRER